MKENKHNVINDYIDKAYQLLHLKNWEEADRIITQLLNRSHTFNDEQKSRIYIGKFFTYFKINKFSDTHTLKQSKYANRDSLFIISQTMPYVDSNTYSLLNDLHIYLSNTLYNEKYADAENKSKQMMFYEAASIYNSINEYKDSKERAHYCRGFFDIQKDIFELWHRKYKDSREYYYKYGLVKDLRGMCLLYILSSFLDFILFAIFSSSLEKNFNDLFSFPSIIFILTTVLSVALSHRIFRKVFWKNKSIFRVVFDLMLGWDIGVFIPVFLPFILPLYSIYSLLLGPVMSIKSYIKVLRIISYQSTTDSHIRDFIERDFGFTIDIYLSSCQKYGIPMDTKEKLINWMIENYALLTIAAKDKGFVKYQSEY